MPDQAGGPRVLVVDDGTEVRALISSALTRRGYTVDAAATLAAARALRPERYDAVLVDADLGADQGTDLVAELCALGPAAAQRCLMITGGSAESVPAGVAWLAKPFTLTGLAEAVHGCLQPVVRSRPPVPARSAAGAAAAPGAPPAQAPAAPEPGLSAWPAWRVVQLGRTLREQAGRELVNYLHDGPIQDLTAATLAVQMMPAGGLAGDSPSAAALLGYLESAASALRWLMDGQSPLQPAPGLLADLVRQHAAWLAAGIEVAADGVQPQWLGSRGCRAVCDVVDLVLAAVLAVTPGAQVQITLQAGEDALSVVLAVAAADGRTGEPGNRPAMQAVFTDLTRALGVAVQLDPAEDGWQVEVAFGRPQLTGC